jgi:hypothetical protein
MITTEVKRQKRRKTHIQIFWWQLRNSAVKTKNCYFGFLKMVMAAPWATLELNPSGQIGMPPAKLVYYLTGEFNSQRTRLFYK